MRSREIFRAVAGDRLAGLYLKYDERYIRMQKERIRSAELPILEGIVYDNTEVVVFRIPGNIKMRAIKKTNLQPVCFLPDQDSLSKGDLPNDRIN